MKTAKEKAIELVDEFYDKMFDLRDGYNSTEIYQAVKQCALIAVDFAIEQIDWHEFETPNTEFEYLQEVKTEIEKL